VSRYGFVIEAVPSFLSEVLQKTTVWPLLSPLAVAILPFVTNPNFYSEMEGSLRTPSRPGVPFFTQGLGASCSPMTTANDLATWIQALVAGRVINAAYRRGLYYGKLQVGML
jgi:hypothetical protein